MTHSINRAVLVLGVLVGITSILAPAAADETYYYHPVGDSCPVWPYRPDVPGEQETARAMCESYAGKSCVVAHGSYVPAC